MNLRVLDVGPVHHITYCSIPAYADTKLYCLQTEELMCNQRVYGYYVESTHQVLAHSHWITNCRNRRTLLHNCGLIRLFVKMLQWLSGFNVTQSCALDRMSRNVPIL